LAVYCVDLSPTGEIFCQKEPIWNRIKNILAEYPEGSYLSECIQNADDCNATEVRFCISSKSFPSHTVVNPAYAKFHGPALYVFNDKVFTDQDFANIQNLGNSNKKRNLQATGQFGLGINSVYHTTDFMTIVSRTSQLISDPNEIVFKEGGQASYFAFFICVGWIFPFDELAAFPDQRLPYQIWGCNMIEEFPGTIFRLPFRYA
jgi:sacsin